MSLHPPLHQCSTMSSLKALTLSFYYSYLMYLKILYYSNDGILHPCVANTRPRSEQDKMDLYYQCNRFISYIHSDSVSRILLSDNDNNDIRVEYIPGNTIDLIGFSTGDDVCGWNRHHQA